MKHVAHPTPPFNRISSQRIGLATMDTRAVANNVEGNETIPSLRGHAMHSRTPLWQHDHDLVRIPASFARTLYYDLRGCEFAPKTKLLPIFVRTAIP